MFGKLEKGKLRFAPKRLSDGSVIVYNPPAELCFSNGYKPVEFTAPPEAPEGCHYVYGWEETTEAIVQTWHLEELPDDISEAEALDIILGGAP